MTFNGRPGAPAVVFWGTRLELFARAPHDGLLHVWNEFGDAGAELLPGVLAGEPSVVATSDGLHVFARGVGGCLLHWQWVRAEEGTGPRDHPDWFISGPHIRPKWRVAYDPVAVGGPDASVHVYARSATDNLLVWESPDGVAWPDRPSWLDGDATSKPAVVYRVGQREPDVFARGETGALIHWGNVHTVDGGLGASEDLGGELAGPRDGPPASPPAVVSWHPYRLDILAELTSGEIAHWGWDGLDPFWYKAERDDASGQFGGPAVAVSPGKDLAEVYCRASNGMLNAWLWDGTGGWFTPYNRWMGPVDVGGPVGSDPAAVMIGGQAWVFAWDPTGRTLLRFIRNAQGTWDRSVWDFEWPSASEPPLAEVRARTRVDYLLQRPADMAILGVSWSGYELTGEPAVLQRVAGADSWVGLALPPQHIGEEVSAGPGPWPPPIAGSGGAPFGSWRSLLSGPSQLVFKPAVDRIELTPAGILAALQGAAIVPASPDGLDALTPEDPPQTVIELPWQLLIAPSGDSSSEHRRDVVTGDDGGAGLWRARLRSVVGSLDVLRAGGEDAFPMALGAAPRELIASQHSPAALRRLEVSALGGSLTAHGDWPAVSWEHDASLARDHRVRVQVSGVLYPFGHRAEYVELTERFPSEPDAEPIAMLRMRRVLTVTETLRGPPDDEKLARAFPFDAVEILTSRFGDIDDPWLDGKKFRRNPRPPAELVAELQNLREAVARMPDPPGDWVGGPPVMELRASADEERPGDEEAAKQAAIANEYLRLIEEIQRTQEQIAAVMEATAEDVPWYFCPRRQGEWITVTAQCRIGDTTVDLQLPVLFVVDVQLPATPILPGFDSLRDGDIDRKLAEKWASIRQLLTDTASPTDPDAVRAGVLSVPGTPLDLIRAGKPSDVQVVDALNVVGVKRDRSIHPRLGPEEIVAPAPGGSAPPTWGLQLELPALRGLLPDKPESHRAPVRFSDDYLARGPIEDVAFVVAGADVPVDFTTNADRSGGLVAPKLAVDAISRATGPVNLEGLRSLKAEDYFDPAATILGFPLVSLLAQLAEVDGAPTITTDLSGPQPVVELAWTDVTLTPSPKLGFVGDAQNPPILNLTVRTCGGDSTTHCVLTDFGMSFPPKSPLLTLTFKSLTYDQTAGSPPTLKVDGLNAEFSGELDLLQTLQEKVSLGNAGPSITVSTKDIVASYTLPVPDAAAGAFVMRNLAFRAAVIVPFGGDPVTVSVGFASRANPFNLSVLALGGGGYIDLELNRDGLSRLEISLEFGASVEVDFVVASGEAHILGGIRFELLPDRSARVTGYLRIGGSLEVLGLVSVSVELVLSLGYQTTGNKLVGRATLVLEIDLTLFSDSVEIDSGEWVISGGEPAHPLHPTAPLPEGAEDPFLSAWLQHRRAFEPVR